MNDLLARDGELIDADTIRFERLLPGPVERVWAYLTESDKRRLWLASGDFDLRPGGKTTLFFQHKNLSSKRAQPPEQFRKMDEEGGGFDGRILRCEPPRVLAITWGGEQSSEVTFELTPQTSGEVLLTLTHRRLSKDDMRNVGPGWHTHLDILADRLSGREPENFWVTLERARAHYEGKLHSQ
jgi:uncharacterized protein YndB with AHSA1/START domain